MEAKVKASYDAAVVGVKVTSDADYVSSLKNVNIKVFALGGDQSRAAAMFNGESEKLGEFLTEGGGIETGVPLSYVVRNVKDNSVVNVKVASDYDVTTCRILEKERFYSGFAENREGWTGYDNGSVNSGNVFWKSEDDCGGNWGGCLLITDNGDLMRYSAPALWRDAVSWLAFLGGRIRYVGRIGASGSWSWISDRNDLEIRGKAGILTFNLPLTVRGRMLDGWEPIEVELDEDGTVLNYGAGDITVYWMYNGQRATREDMESVLSEVTNFLIQAEYISGSDWMKLDEVEILAPNVGGVGGGFPAGG